MHPYLKVFVLCFYFSQCTSFTTVINADDRSAETSVTPKINNSTAIIRHEILKKPHHLFIGRCKPDDQVIHQENIIVYNDGKSQVAAAIKLKLLDVSLTMAVGTSVSRLRLPVIVGETSNSLSFKTMTDNSPKKKFEYKVQVRDPVYITCVKIFDEIPDGKGGYPSYVGGGVGQDYVEFNVDTEYGRGFHFYIQLFGYSLEQKENNVR